MSYRGKRKSRFSDIKEQTAYSECWKWHHKLAYWTKKMESLCARLLFYNVSLKQHETITVVTDELLALIDFYHDRWQIEIGFKLTKYTFRVKTNCRKPTGRHVRRVISEMMYNSWHYTELTRIARDGKKMTHLGLRFKTITESREKITGQSIAGKDMPWDIFYKNWH